MRRAYVVPAALSMALSGLALFGAVRYYNDERAAQGRQGVALEQKLCTTLGRLAALTPPPGSPAQNPSRAYDQELHAVLAQLGPDLGCERKS